MHPIKENKKEKTPYELNNKTREAPQVSIPKKILKPVKEHRIQLLNPRHSIGVDIGNRKVKIVEIVSDKIIDSVILDTPYLNGDNGDIDKEKLADELEKALSPRKNKAGNLAISLPAESLNSVIFTLPPMPKAEFKKVVINESKRKMIPAPASDDAFSYSILGEKVVDNISYTEIMGVSTSNNILEENLSFFEKIDFLPTLISTPNSALLSAFISSVSVAKDENIGLIDIGATNTSITVVRDNAVRFFRTVLIGCKDIISAVVKNLAVDKNEAEKILQEIGIPIPDVPLPEKPEEKVKVAEAIMMQKYEVTQGNGKDYGTSLQKKLELAFAMKPVWDRLIEEINRSFIYYKTKISGGKAISEIYLSGGGAILKGVDRFFARKLNMEVTVLNLLQNLRLASQADKMKAVSPQLAVATGLALQARQKKKEKGINFLPIPLQRKAREKMQAITLTGMNIVFAGILLIVFFILQARGHSYEKQMGNCAVTLSKFSQIISLNDEIKRQKQEYQNKISILEKLTENTPEWYDIFRTLSNVMPSNIFLSSLNIKKEQSSLVKLIEKRMITRTRGRRTLKDDRSCLSMSGTIYATYERTEKTLRGITSRLNASPFFKEATLTLEEEKGGIQIGIKKERGFEITALIDMEKNRKK